MGIVPVGREVSHVYVEYLTKLTKLRQKKCSVATGGGKRKSVGEIWGFSFEKRFLKKSTNVSFALTRTTIKKEVGKGLVARK